MADLKEELASSTDLMEIFSKKYNIVQNEYSEEEHNVINKILAGYEYEGDNAKFIFWMGLYNAYEKNNIEKANLLSTQ